MSSDFKFHDTPPLVDGELQLVQPSHSYIDAYLAAARHPLTVIQAPALSKETRSHLLDLLDFAPMGRFLGWVPGYHFWMVIAGAPFNTKVAGTITLRIGHTRDIEMYVGHVGYQVFPSQRGNHYAERACRLLLPLAESHGVNPLWITCNPDNAASRRTCERLGAEMVEIVPVPENHELYQRGDREKCRYRLWI